MGIQFIKNLAIISVFVFLAIANSIEGGNSKERNKNISWMDTVTIPDISAATRMFKNDLNPYHRAHIIRAVSLVKSKVQKKPSFSEMGEIDEMISAGLKDKYSNVMVEAAILAGSMKRTDLEPDLISIYQNAAKLYPSYWERVRLGIIVALGKSGGEEAKKFLKKMLDNEMDFVVLKSVLLSVNEINDASLAGNVDQLRNKIEKAINMLNQKNADKDMLFHYEEIARLSRMVSSAIRVKKEN